MNGITVKNCDFDTTGHNAIAVQGHDGAVNHKAVTITNNMFKYIGDRIIRFNEVGSDTQITITYNRAENSGDGEKQVIKATSLEAGAGCVVKYNSWGENSTVANAEFMDSADAYWAETATELSSAINEAEAGDSVVLDTDVNLGSGQLAINEAVNLELNGNTLSADYGWGIITLKNGASIKNGTIDVKSNVAAIRAFDAEAIENVTINILPRATEKVATAIAVQAGSHVGTIRNVTVTSATQGIEVLPGASVDLIENVNVNTVSNGSKPGVALQIEAGAVGKVVNSRFNGETYGAQMLLKNGFAVALELDDCEISGKTAGIYAHTLGDISDIEKTSLTLTYDEDTVINGGLQWEFDDTCKDLVELNAPSGN